MTDKPQKPERLISNFDRGDQCGFSAKLRIKNQTNGKGELFINETEGFAFAQNVAQGRKRFDVERSAVFFD